MEITPHQVSQRAKEDKALIKAALEQNSQQAYEKLMLRYKDAIFFMMLKMVNNRDDAEDLTIEAFGKVFNSLEKYDTEYAFSTWLYKIASNNAIDFMRRKKFDTLPLQSGSKNKDDEFKLDLANKIKSSAPDPEEVFIQKQRAELMKGVLDKLNTKYRQLVEMRYFRELSYDEIATELDLPLGTVKAQIHRAKELLYAILKGKRLQ